MSAQGPDARRGDKKGNVKERDEKRRQRERDEQARDAIEKEDRRRENAVRVREKEYGRVVAGERGRRGRQQTPWLLLRAVPDDLGIRPMAPGSVFWCSPDVWVESEDPFGNAVAGRPNYVHARLFNLGAFQAAPVKLDFYWGNPAVGLGPGDMHHIGTEYVELPSLTSRVVRCETPWVPVMLNDGHECVMVNASCWVSDPITAPFMPMLDRHVGQRNLHVTTLPAGESMMMSLMVANVFPIAVRVEVGVRSWRLRMVRRDAGVTAAQLGALAAGFMDGASGSVAYAMETAKRGSDAHRNAQKALTVERRHRAAKEKPLFRLAERERAGPRVVTRLHDKSGELHGERGGGFAGRLLSALDAKQPAADEGAPGAREVVQTVSLQPRSYRMLDLKIAMPDDMREDEIAVIHVDSRVGPMTVGGYTVVVLNR